MRALFQKKREREKRKNLWPRGEGRERADKRATSSVAVARAGVDRAGRSAADKDAHGRGRDTAGRKDGLRYLGKGGPPRRLTRDTVVLAAQTKNHRPQAFDLLSTVYRGASLAVVVAIDHDKEIQRVVIVAAAGSTAARQKSGDDDVQIKEERRGARENRHQASEDGPRDRRVVAPALCADGERAQRAREHRRRRRDPVGAGGEVPHAIRNGECAGGDAQHRRPGSRRRVERHVGKAPRRRTAVLCVVHCRSSVCLFSCTFHCSLFFFFFSRIKKEKKHGEVQTCGAAARAGRCSCVFCRSRRRFFFPFVNTRPHNAHGPTQKGAPRRRWPSEGVPTAGTGLWAPVSFLPLADLEKKSMNCPEKKSAERTEALVSCASASGSLFLLSCTHGAFFLRSLVFCFSFFFSSPSFVPGAPLAADKNTEPRPAPLNK